MEHFVPYLLLFNIIVSLAADRIIRRQLLNNCRCDIGRECVQNGQQYFRRNIVFVQNPAIDTAEEDITE